MPGWMEGSTTNCEGELNKRSMRIADLRKASLSFKSAFRNLHFKSPISLARSPLIAWRFSAAVPSYGQ
jgi:hypothetical protein